MATNNGINSPDIDGGTLPTATPAIGDKLLYQDISDANKLKGSPLSDFNLPSLGFTGLTAYAAGDLIYASAANTLAKLAIGQNGKFLRIGGTLGAPVPAWDSVPFSISNGGASSGVSAIGLPGLFSVAQSNSQAQTLATILNTKVLFVPFMLGDNYFANNIQVMVVAHVAAATITAGIYEATDTGQYKNFPKGAPIAVGQVTSTAANTLKTINLGAGVQLYEAKLYYMGIMLSTATTFSIGVCQTNFGPASFLSPGAGTWSQVAFTYTATYSAGSLPTLTNASIGASAANYLPLCNLTI